MNLPESSAGNPHAEILYRLRCAAGHLNAVIFMLEDEQSCEDILHQLNAVRAALHTAGAKLIHCQTSRSEALILDSSSNEQRAVELKRLRALYTLLIRTPEPLREVLE